MDARVRLSGGGSGRRRRRRPTDRRLTLAPTPMVPETPVAMDTHLAVEAPFSNGGRDGSLSADPLAGLRHRPFGSKFWPLAEDWSSDDEGDDVGDGVCLLNSLQMERTSSELQCTPIRTPSPLSSEAELTPNVCSRSGVAGTEVTRRDSGRRRLRSAASPLRSLKPWHGPLPPARVSPKVSLADALARARYASGTGSWCRAPTSPAPAAFAGECRLDVSGLVRTGFRDPGWWSAAWRKDGPLYLLCWPWRAVCACGSTEAPFGDCTHAALACRLGCLTHSLRGGSGVDSGWWASGGRRR